MRLRIIHKGLFVVVVSCLVQFSIIGALGYLLASTQAEHDLAVKRRAFALKAARLVFANCHSASKILAAWETTKYLAGRPLPPWQSMKSTSEARLEIADLNQYIRQIIHELENEPEPDPVLRDLKQRCSKVERAVMKVHQHIEELVLEGATPETLVRSIGLRKEIWDRTEQITIVIWKLVKTIDDHQQKSEAAIQQLKQYEFVVLAGGLLLNIVAAALFLYLFDRNIIKRAAAIQSNIGSIEREEGEYLPVSGSDEIAQFDRAFRAMSDEIRSVRKKEQALFENAADVICVIDGEGFVERVNQACEKFWGYPPAQLVDKWIGQIFPTMQLEQVSDALSQTRQTKSGLSFESVVIAADGTLKESLWSVIWSERQSNWYCVVRDIGLEKQIEEEKRRFLDLIVSDLQQPLHRISSLFQKLTENTVQTPEKLSTRLKNTQKTVQRINGLIDSLVEFNQSADLGLLTESKELTPSPVSQVVADAVRDVSEIARVRNITIKTDCPEVQWTVEQPQLVRVLVNLLSNAIKFSPGGGQVDVRIRNSDDTVYLEVEDAGRGIPEAEIGQLFRPFRQTQAQDGARGVGSGLGLFAVRQIIEGQGGRIGVSSEEGKGSKFWFSLPSSKNGSDASVNSRSDRAGTTNSAPLFTLSSDRLSTSASGATASRELVEAAPQRRYSSSLQNKAWILIFVPVLFQVIFAVIMMFQILHERSLFERESKERIVITDSIQTTLGQLRTGVRLDRYYGGALSDEECRKGINTQLNRIKKYKRVLQQDELAAGSADIMEALASARRALLSALDVVGERQQMLTYSREASLRAHELSFAVEKLLDRYDSEGASVMSADSFRRQAIFLLLALLAASLSAWFLAVRFSRDVAQRLDTLATNCHRFSIDLPLEPPISGSDQIARLDASFRTSAHRLLGLREKETAFLKNSQSLICTLSNTGVFDSVNAVATRFFNTPMDSILFRNLITFVPAEERESVKEALTRAKTEGSPVQLRTHITTSARDLLWSITWSDSEKSYFGIAHDITQQLELERMKREYTAVISHDLRTPLTTILGLSVLGLTGVLGPTQEETSQLLEQVRSNTEHVIDLINDLLDLEKLMCGELMFDPATTKANSLIDKACLEVREYKLVPPFQFSHNAGEEELLVDRARLSFALSALIMEVLSTGARDIVTTTTTTTTTTDRQNISFELEISSNDQADESEIKRALSRFADPFSSQATYGSQLRLPLALRFIAAQDGVLQAQERDGKLAILLQLKQSGSHK